MKKWQRELLNLRGNPCEKCTTTSGLFLFDDAKTIRWTSPESLYLTSSFIFSIQKKGVIEQPSALNSASLDVSHSEALSHLLTSFHRDRPKASRVIPEWNLSLVLQMFTKEPFEPRRKASLKHLTLKQERNSRMTPQSEQSGQLEQNLYCPLCEIHCQEPACQARL